MKRTIWALPASSQLFVGGLLAYLIAAWCTKGYYHPDEHFQILEFANYKMGFTPQWGLAWEHAAQIRPALQPIMVWGLMYVGYGLGMSDPFVFALLLRLLSAMLMFGLLWRFSRYLSADFQRPYLLTAAALFLWFMPFLGARFSSENWSALTLLVGLYMLMRFEEPSKNEAVNPKYNLLKAATIGFLFGLSFWLRFQMAFALAGITVWSLYNRHLSARSIVALICGGLIAVGLNIGLDSWFYGNWVLTPLRYFQVNILEDKAAQFGVSPWWWYLPEANRAMKIPLGTILLAFFLTGVHLRRNHLMTWVLIPFVLGHALVAHKEMRFLFPVIFPFLYLAAHGFEYWMMRIKTIQQASPTQAFNIQHNTHHASLITHNSKKWLSIGFLVFNAAFLWIANTRSLQVCSLETALAATARWDSCTLYTDQLLVPKPGPDLEPWFYLNPRLKITLVSDPAQLYTLPWREGDLLLTHQPASADVLLLGEHPAKRIFRPATHFFKQIGLQPDTAARVLSVYRVGGN
jgi:Alg9-like mannosyltransferase family